MLKDIKADEAWAPVPKRLVAYQRTSLHGLPDDVCNHHPGLIIGAFADRMKFSAFTIFLVAWVLLGLLPCCSLGMVRFDGYRCFRCG